MSKKYKIDAQELKVWLQSLLEECHGNSFDVVLEVSTQCVGYGMAEHDETVGMVKTEGLRFSPHGKEEKILGPKGFDYLVNDTDDDDDE